VSDAGKLIIFGASTRAAAFSALRAGLRPWCADLFADRDLATHCTVVKVPPRDYPHGFMELARQCKPGPWMYTGALENRRKLVGRISNTRPLWGNHGRALELCRSPQWFTSMLAREALPYAQLTSMSKEPPTDRRWLLKPLHGAAGAGITFRSPREAAAAVNEKAYCQEYIEGEACSAVYVANGQEARFASATRQLVGEAWLHAGPFQYCASIGPQPLNSGVRSVLEKIGTMLTRGCRLRGLFGVDFIIDGDKPYPIEINPRYPASVEVLEYATGWRALADHARVFDANAGEPMPPSPTARFAGKAILFARDTLVFPEDGPWLPGLRHPASVHELPSFADIPHAGERIERGRPILTMFASAASVSACINSLRLTARDLDRWFFGD
jgi:uncharacterized protein